MAIQERTASRSSVSVEYFYYTVADWELAKLCAEATYMLPNRMTGYLAYITGWCQSTSITLPSDQTTTVP